MKLTKQELAVVRVAVKRSNKTENIETGYTYMNGICERHNYVRKDLVVAEFENCIK